MIPVLLYILFVLIPVIISILSKKRKKAIASKASTPSIQIPSTPSTSFSGHDEAIHRLHRELKTPLSEIVVKAERQAVVDFAADWDLDLSSIAEKCADYAHSWGNGVACKWCGMCKYDWEGDQRQKKWVSRVEYPGLSDVFGKIVEPLYGCGRGNHDFLRYTMGGYKCRKCGNVSPIMDKEELLAYENS